MENQHFLLTLLTLPYHNHPNKKFNPGPWLDSGPRTRKQCCGSASASNKNTDPNPQSDPHQTQSDKLDPDQFADDKPKCMEYEPILALFQRVEPLFGS
jgi:hypothetical protein